MTDPTPTPRPEQRIAALEDRLRIWDGRLDAMRRIYEVIDQRLAALEESVLGRTRGQTSDSGVTGGESAAQPNPSETPKGSPAETLSGEERDELCCLVIDACVESGKPVWIQRRDAILEHVSRLLAARVAATEKRWRADLRMALDREYALRREVSALSARLAESSLRVDDNKTSEGLTFQPAPKTARELADRVDAAAQPVTYGGIPIVADPTVPEGKFRVVLAPAAERPPQMDGIVVGVTDGERAVARDLIVIREWALSQEARARDLEARLAAAERERDEFHVRFMAACEELHRLQLEINDYVNGAESSGAAEVGMASQGSSGVAKAERDNPDQHEYSSAHEPDNRSAIADSALIARLQAIEKDRDVALSALRVERRRTESVLARIAALESKLAAAERERADVLGILWEGLLPDRRSLSDVARMVLENKARLHEANRSLGDALDAERAKLAALESERARVRKELEAARAIVESNEQSASAALAPHNKDARGYAYLSALDLIEWWDPKMPELLRAYRAATPAPTNTKDRSGSTATGSDAVGCDDPADPHQQPAPATAAHEHDAVSDAIEGGGFFHVEQCLCGAKRVRSRGSHALYAPDRWPQYSGPTWLPWGDWSAWSAPTTAEPMENAS